MQFNIISATEKANFELGLHYKDIKVMMKEDHKGGTVRIILEGTVGEGGRAHRVWYSESLQAVERYRFNILEHEFDRLLWRMKRRGITRKGA